MTTATLPTKTVPAGVPGASATAAPSTPHRWSFIRAGGLDQVVFRSGADIAHIAELDQKLWVALACPTRGIDFDSRTLDLIDTDRDGRVRPPEVIAACQWACERLRSADALLAGGGTLSLDDLDDKGAAGADLAREGRRILDLLGKKDLDTLTLADISDRSEWLAAMRFNGDGVVTPETAATDEALRAAIEEAMRTHGSTPDRHEKKPGLDRARAEAFMADAKAMRDWYANAQNSDEAVLPLADRTLAATEALRAVAAKIDDFFARCRVAAYDVQAVAALNPSPEAYDALSGHTLEVGAQPIAELPLAPVTPSRSLPLRGTSLNPAWADAMALFARDTVAPLLGELDALEEEQWQSLRRRLGPCEAWVAARPANALAGLSRERIDELLATHEALFALIAEDEAAEHHNKLLVDLEKLLRLQRDLLVLLHNFVSFKAFYWREGAIFQAGKLYLDGRSCELTVQVQDTARHATLAGLAKTCLAYCDCTRQGQKMSIVAAFTAGDVDFLFVGRNGVFYDREGRDWDATITKLIENPTSVAQAFFAPYKKFVRMIEEQVAKRAAASEAGSQGALQSLAGRVATADRTAGADAAPKPPAKPGVPPAGSRIDVGTVAAIGVALGSISAVLVGIFGKFIDLGQWIPVALAGIVIAISGPSMLIAWLKLRQRSLGPILDASGWAINGRMKVSVRLGGMLSQTAHVPPGAKRIAPDPYRERHGLAGAVAAACIVGAVVLLAWRMDWLDGRLPPRLQHDPAAASAPGA